ncbi:hypothetical protein [Pararhizobium sp. O133]|uniref:hypothetical protein n=1 Tax=Pararhizobium sp. O133 TaxID=3449278 RepID=UPI003F684CA4
MPIIATKDGTNINSEHVVQYSKLRNGLTRFLLSTGGEVTVETYREDIDELFIPVIPASQPFVAVFVERWEDGVFQYKHRTVIAWRICASGKYPVFDGYDHGADDYAVMIDPAGGVYDCDQNRYDTLGAWKAEYEAEANLAVARSVSGIAA